MGCFSNLLSNFSSIHLFDMFFIYFLEENNSLMLHLYFCNDLQKRSWIKENQIFEFSGKKKLVSKFPKIIVS